MTVDQDQPSLAVATPERLVTLERTASAKQSSDGGQQEFCCRR